MRNTTQTRSTQTNYMSVMNQQEDQGEGVEQSNDQNIQIAQPPLQQSAQNNRQQALDSNNLNQNNDEQSMGVFVIIASFFMGLFDLIVFLLSGIKKLIPSPIRNLFKRKCSRHSSDDLCMDCTSCQETMRLPGRKYNENECAICYYPIKNKVFYSCQHSCCAECTVKCMERNKKMRCMFCRKYVDMIYRDFNAEGDNKLIELRNRIRSYNSTFAPKDRSLFAKIRDSPFLLQRTINFIFTREGVMYMLGHICSSHFFIVGLLYIISPLDLLPEFIFGIFGLLDDIVVMGILFVLLTNFYYRYLLRQEQENSSSDSN